MAIAGGLLVVGLAGGFLIGRGLGEGRDPQLADPRPNAPDVTLPTPADPAFERGTPVAGDAPPAPDPRTAMTLFLEAEVAGNHAQSFSLLAPQDRADVGLVDQWALLHGDMPQITGFDIRELREEGGDRVNVVTRLELQPVLDEFIGMIPAEADATWPLVEEDGQWRVAYSDATLDPRYPPDDRAPAAALDWARASQACAEPDTGYEGLLLGEAARSHDLCGTEGTPEVGAPQELPADTAATPFVDAFGPDVYDWARVVPLTGPTSLGLVMAPLGDEWVVIGVLDA